MVYLPAVVRPSELPSILEDGRPRQRPAGDKETAKMHPAGPITVKFLTENAN
jgi:hypothetical protein